jgi:DNA topoisomerase I
VIGRADEGSKRLSLNTDMRISRSLIFCYAVRMRLKYVTDERPGFTRRKRWGVFRFFDEHGKKIRNKEILDRVRSLGIPPAYTDVWICPFENGHIQATARDARGRKQYIYHADWIAQRDEAKFDRLLTFANVLPKIRRRITRDLALRGMPKEKVLAAIVKLLDTDYIRIGNDEYAKDNHSFGLTTLQNKHVKGSGPSMKLVFKGKSGVAHEVQIDDARLRKIVAACHDLPGHELFEYLDDNGGVHDVKSDDVNAYVQSITNEEITAKDFRTWHGTVIAATSLWSRPIADTKKERTAACTAAIKEAASALGNTVAVCKKCYIHPMILLAYQQGRLERPILTERLKKRYTGLRMHEVQLVHCLLVDE